MIEASPRPITIVGIAGGTASGKSTFTRALASALQEAQPSMSVEMLGTDRYFRFGTPEMPTIMSPSVGSPLPDFNHPDALDLPRFLADLEKQIQSPGAPDVLLIEGLMVLHISDIRDRLDLRLFVELDADARALRRLVRNLGHRYDPIPDHSPQSIA
ncbi:MAG: hypothetical protein JXA89_14365, partial [Anaerolineae bacterium]|nr:hypothetical protein [Anaerolineae bacterium]